MVPVIKMMNVAICWLTFHLQRPKCFLSDYPVLRPEKLEAIHKRLQLLHGSFKEEYPEQLLATTFISEEDKVLELGGNIGRNSCVIGAMLKEAGYLVVMEPDPDSAKMLIANRDHNRLNFHVENAALSKVPLIQSGWHTTPGRVPPPGYYKINTLSYTQLKSKYQHSFDVLVADCEGALYSIIQNDGDFLEDFRMIIVENDYLDRSHFEYVRSQFIASGFELVYNQAGGSGPCYKEFYQVWVRSGA